MFKEPDSQRLAPCLVCGWLALNFPLLGLWDVDATWWGVPVFPAALFALWALLIAVVAWLVERQDVRRRTPSHVVCLVGTGCLGALPAAAVCGGLFW
jgi:hypothetical protein